MMVTAYYILLMLNSWALGDAITKMDLPMAMLNGSAALFCAYNIVIYTQKGHRR